MEWLLSLRALLSVQERADCGTGRRSCSPVDQCFGELHSAAGVSVEHDWGDADVLVVARGGCVVELLFVGENNHAMAARSCWQYSGQCTTSVIQVEFRWNAGRGCCGEHLVWRHPIVGHNLEPL